MNKLEKIGGLGSLIVTLSVLLFICFHGLSFIYSGWLADEIFHIRFINEWFLQNFWNYFFQIQHIEFPPRSPVFGNPPFAMFLMTFGMWLGSLFNFDFLYGARAVNVVAGLVSLYLIFRVAKETLGKGVGYYAVLLFSTFPALVVINTTAYLDALLITLILLFVLFAVLFDKTKQKHFLYISAFVAGIAFITKYQFLFVFIPTVLILLPNNIRHIRAKDWILYPFIVWVTGAMIWVGFRDINQLIAIFNTVSGFTLNSSQTTGGLFSDYVIQTGGQLNSVFYYVYQLIGKLSWVLVIGLLFFLVLLSHIKQKEIKYTLLFFTLGTLPLILFGLLGGVPNTIHRIAMSFPFVIIIASLGYEFFARYIKGKYKVQTNILIFFVVFIVSVTTIGLVNPSYYNFYTNGLNLVFNTDGTKFRNGDGEGMQEVAEWFSSQRILENRVTTIGVARFRFVLSEYLPNTTLVDFPLNESCDFAYARGIDYLVVHASHITGGLSPLFLQNTECLELVYTVFHKKEPVVFVYKLRESERFTFAVPFSFEPEWINAKSDNSTVTYDQEASKIQFYYSIQGGDWVFLSSKIEQNLRSFDGVLLTIANRNTEKNPRLYLDLVSAPDEIGYYRHRVDLDFVGEKTFLIKFDQFKKWESDIAQTNIDITDADSLKVSIDSEEDIDGFLEIIQLSLYKQ